LDSLLRFDIFRRLNFKVRGVFAVPDPFRNQARYDIMQVCENGHKITGFAKSQPESRRKYCPACGAATLMACRNCQEPIKGYLHIPTAIYDDETLPPVFCEECSEAFPWTAKVQAEKETNMAQASNRVFIVHGHAEDMKQAAARVLTTLGLDPIILHEQPNEGRTIIEKFETHAEAGFAVVLLSGDDMAYPASIEHKKAKPRPRARQNVILELGYFLGKLGRNKIFALYNQVDNFELPSDIQGVIYTPYDAAGSWRFTLAQELKAVGYNVDANKLLRS
jgi:predicted nucleotide-binding protein